MHKELEGVTNSETNQVHPKSHSSRQLSDCCDARPTRKQIFQRTIKEEYEILSRINTALDPLQKMPIEVVSCIFEHTLGDEDNVTPFRQCLGQVCQYWRRVTWSTPSLWKNFTFTINSFYNYEEENYDEDVSAKHIEYFYTCVSRSGSLPLFVSALYREIQKSTAVRLSGVALIIEAIKKLDIAQRIFIFTSKCRCTVLLISMEYG